MPTAHWGPVLEPRRIPTATSSFGVSRRENHDASTFYERFTAPQVDDDTEVNPHKEINEIFCGHAASMPQVPDKSVGLVVTSPPYFAGKEYELAVGVGHVPASYFDYLAMLEAVFAECVRTLEPGGRIAVNVANLGRRPYRSLSADIMETLENLGLLLRGEIIWRKARGSTGSCAWGSFQRPTNPVLRDLTERVVVASKGRFDRALSAEKREERGLPFVGSVSKDEFMEATTDVWEIPSESATRVGHPAPFPVGLPERLIHLYTYVGDLVLDPFMGSGTTAVAAVNTGRNFVGYDTDASYVARAHERIEQARRTDPTDAPSRPDDEFGRALATGASVKEVAEILLRTSGFTGLETNVRIGAGAEVSYRGRDALGNETLFEVVGGFTTTTSGLKRADTMWRVLGKAAVVREITGGTPFVVLSTDVPAARSAGDAALRAMCGPDRPIRAVVDIGSLDAPGELRVLAGGSS